jgi:radical SAM protein with 4Fe4S-binding SPASM domain
VDKLRIDGQKLEFHPHRVAQWLDAKDDWEKAKKVYPLYVEVSPMGACNHRCTFCAVDFIGYKAENKLDENILIDRLDEMGQLGVKSVMFAGEGEPLLHKEINEIAQNAIGSGLDVAFTTNGVLLDKLSLEDVSWVKVSINAGTRDTYAKVHRTKEKDWDRVWENLRDAVKRKGTCTIGVQMVCLPENRGEEQELQARCEEAGVDYCVLKPYSQHKMSITRQYEGYKPVNLVGGKNVVVREEAIKTEAHGYDKCNATPFFWAYIMATGDVYSCSAYLLDDRFRLGNISDQTFRSIWESDRRRKNWSLLKDHLDIKDCRVNCRMHRVNEYLTQFGNLPHANFI